MPFERTAGIKAHDPGSRPQTEERLKYGTFLPDRDIKKIVEVENFAAEEELEEIRKGEQKQVESTVPETIDSSTEVEL